MKVTRKISIETNNIQIGDRIQVGHYTATCQKIIGNDIAIFLLDQYLDNPMSMNKMPTNSGGYKNSNIRKELNSENILKDFSGLELVPFENNDLLRLPFYGEMFGHDNIFNSGAVEPDDCEQWELMKERANRIANRIVERKDECYEWGWLQNIHQRSASAFYNVNDSGHADFWSASFCSICVRPVFQIKIVK